MYQKKHLKHLKHLKQKSPMAFHNGIGHNNYD